MTVREDGHRNNDDHKDDHLIERLAISTTALSTAPPPLNSIETHFRGTD